MNFDSRQTHLKWCLNLVYRLLCLVKFISSKKVKSLVTVLLKMTNDIKKQGKPLTLSLYWNIDMQNVSQFYKDVKILSYSIVFITKINY